MSKRIVSATINGEVNEFLVEPYHTLLEALRTEPTTPTRLAAGLPARLVVVLVVLVVVVIHRRHTEVSLDLVESAHPG